MVLFASPLNSLVHMGPTGKIQVPFGHFLLGFRANVCFNSPMNETEQKRALEVALKAAKAGGDITLKYFQKLRNVTLKGSAGLVSEADQESEECIREMLTKEFPNHQVLGEEEGLSGASSSGPMWHVDPLDGTTNYVHGFPFYCVSIGLAVDKDVVVGVVHAPLLNQTFTASKGHGAFMNDQPISVSKTDKLTDTLLATGFSYEKGPMLDQELTDFKSLSLEAHGIRRAGSAALDFCFVASGIFDGFWERKLNSWDTAAGTIIVREAGGIVSDFEGNHFTPDMKTVVAANPNIQPLLLEKILPS